MASGRMLQTSFTDGELSPELDGSPDLEAYFNGLKTSVNWWPVLRGLTRRHGMRFGGEVKTSSKRTILVDFVVSRDQAYFLEMGDGYIRIWKNDALLTTVTGSELLTNGGFDTSLTGWTDADSGGGVSSWYSLFAPGGGGVTAMQLLGTATGHTSARYQSITTSTGTAYRLEFEVLSVSGEASIFIGTSLGSIADVASQELTLGANVLDFTAPASTLFVYFRTVNQAEAVIDSATVKAVGGIVLEVTTPYPESSLPFIHWRQSADVMYFFHPNYETRKLSRLAETNWDFRAVNFDPPPTFEEDEDISDGETLTPGDTTGTGITFTASDAVFLNGDIDRIIVYGQSRAVITAVAGGLDEVTADILDDFPNTDPIPSGSWLLRGPPGGNLDPNRKEPVGVEVTMTSNKNCFRSNIVDKFIRVYDGLIEVTKYTNAASIKGVLKSLMGESAGTGNNPSAADAGTWHIEVSSFSDVYGYPATGEFHQGRLAAGPTFNQPTTWWMSASDSYENFARGTLASDAVEYTIASRRVNFLNWMASVKRALIIGSGEDEFTATGAGTNEPIGGENIPLVDPESSEGGARIQPVITSDGVQFVQRSRRRLYLLRYSIDVDQLNPIDLTEKANHLTKTSPIRQGPIAYQKENIKLTYLSREDGQGLWVRVNLNQEIKGQWGRIVTDGEIEDFCVIPTSTSYQLACIVKRTINGATKRYVEYFDPNVNTDSAKTGTLGVGAVLIGGLTHLEGSTVDVKLNGVYIGQRTVSGGQVMLDEALAEETTYEVGLHYNSTAVSMRPAIPGGSTEARAARWVRPFARLLNSQGGTINGQNIERTVTGEFIDPNAEFSGDAEVVSFGWNENEGRFTIEQNLPYNFTVLCVGGVIDFA